MSHVHSVLVGLLMMSCTGSTAPVRSRTQESRHQVSTAPTSAPGTAPLEAVEPVTLGDVIASPEHYLGRLIVVRGRAGVCPGLCDAIKIRCGLVPPSSGPCTGHGALSLDESPEIEVRCGSGGNGPQNAVLVDVEDTRFACRGHCQKWACPAFELGRHYEVTAHLRTVTLDDAARYELVIGELKELPPAGVRTNSSD